MSDEFKNNQIYKIAYRPTRNPNYSPTFDVELACPNCGETKWIYQDRTGVGKLPYAQMKWKCEHCGQFFICNKDNVTKILGV